MAISSKQVGWGTEENLLWQISKQLEGLTNVTYNNGIVTLQPNRGGTGQTTYTNGQLLIGNTTGNTLSKSTLTPGNGIAITNGNGSITISYTGATGVAVTNVSALTLGTTGTDLSSTVTNPTTTPVITLNIPTASITNRGVLSSTDWNKFNFKPDLVPGTNLFNKDSVNIIDGQYLGTDGEIYMNNASYFISDYIPVLRNTTYVHANFGMGGAYSVIYDINKNVISGFQTGTVTTPSNGYYIRMSGKIANKAIQQFEIGSTSTTYEAYTLTVNATQLKLTQSLVNPFITNKLDKVVGKNLFNPSDPDILVGYYIGYNGSFNVNPYGINVSAWIPISSGQSLKANFGVGNTYVALYNSNKVYVAGSAVNTNVITWQTGAAYARFSYYTPVTNYQIEVGTVSTTYEAYTIYGFIGNITNQVPDRETICILPKKMFFIKNKQNSIYFENVLFKNLQDPTTIYFNKGTNYNRQVTFNFTAAATSQTFTTQIVRSFKKGELKTITYDVIDPVTNNGKTVNAIHVGDSFTDIGAWVKECKVLMNAQGVTYNLVGTNGDSTFRAEGLSGGNLGNTFLNSSAGVGRKVQITGVTTLPSTTYPGRVYRDSTGVDWTIRSGKIYGSGAGYMVVTRYGAVNGDFATFPSSGTLTKQGSGEGDAVINYTNPTFCYFNPFINPSTGNLDITNYITTWGFATPNLIIFQFTWNDTSLWSSDTNLNSLVASFKTAADHVRAAYPSIKVIFSIEPYGSINGNLEWNGKKYTVLRFVELLLIQFEDNSSYNTWVKIAPAYAFVDLVYGYSGSTVAPNDRYPSVTEQSGGDSVHPNTGMLQIADCVAPIISAVI